MAEKRIYEVMYIAAPETTDEDITKLNDGITKQIEDEGGSIVKVEDMGRRRLAYTINKKTEGHYVLFEIAGSGQEIAELERRMRVNDLIMRFITVRVDEERKAAQKLTDKREKRINRRSGASDNGDAGAESAAESAQGNQ